MSHRSLGFFTTVLLVAPLLACAAGDDVIGRTVLPGAAGPYAATVAVSTQARLVFTAGVVSDVADPTAQKDSAESYGSVETQTTSILKQLNAMLAVEGMHLADAVRITVFVVPAPKTGKMDFAGLNAAYGRFFGSAEQPYKAARSTVGVAVLPRPGPSVEIDVIAARMP
jgi:enamine deaminase RidA (YjgF/YER057c/UK114 family)